MQAVFVTTMDRIILMRLLRYCRGRRELNNMVKSSPFRGLGG
ncbi:MAG: hypothetical protein JWP45_2501 [Mucilaginibacter sp.]|nr:hypothetical protein [Mucilaginibacter sp.]